MKNVSKTYLFILLGFLQSHMFLVGSIYFLFFDDEKMMNKFTFLYYIGFSLIQGFGLMLIFYLFEKRNINNSDSK